MELASVAVTHLWNLCVDLTKLGGMQSPGGHLPAGMKRKLDLGLPLSNSDEQHEGRVPI